MIMNRLLAYFGIVLLVCGCGLEEAVLQDICGSQIEFSASRMRIITKAGDSAEPFGNNTSFKLFGVQNGSDWSEEGTKFYAIEGTGNESGIVNYSIDGKKASYDVGKNLDFYGVTYGTSSEVQVDGSAGSAPTVCVSLSGNAFPDLMYSDNLKNKNSSSGMLNMEFRHTLSKLKFEILKQDENSDPVGDRKLENVTLKKVVLMGSASSATFNVKTGEWTETAFDVRTVYDGTMKVENAAQPLKSEDSDIEMLVVPNSNQLTLQVTLDMDGDTGTQEYKVIDYKLMSSETDMLHLGQNYEYTLSIVILKNDVRIVTVTPKVYEWVDVDLGEVAYFGQPVYFAGLMWMDRNLGAKSADCENDWYNSIGYYYQFGRNIPYMLDVDAYLADSGKSFKFTGGDLRTTDTDAVFNLKFLYTYDNHGHKVTTVKHANHSSGTCLYDKIAINPGDEGDYSYIRGYIYKDGSGEKLNNQSWAKQNLDLTNPDDSQVIGSFDNHIFWQNRENQPCPKGWRLPEKADMYSFMPESRTLFWLDIYKQGDPLNKALGDRDADNDGTIESQENDHANYNAGNTNAAGEEYEWKYFAGLFKVDPTADKSVSFSYPVSDAYSRVYGIKYEGEDKVYRVMFEQMPSRYRNRNFVRISRFASHTSDRFEISDDGKQWNIHKFDWSTPVEYMDIPLAGFIYEDSMSDFGKGVILRAVEGDYKGHNWTMYLRSGHNGVAVAGGSRRILGENIRCVRDINAK